MPLGRIGTTADIAARAITVTAVADIKAYDGTKTSNKIPTIALPGLATGDTAQFIQTFDSANVTGPRTLTPSGSVADGNTGKNYAVTFVPLTINSGAITAAAVQPTITAANKAYDGTTAATIATRTLSGVFPGDTVTLTGGTATFADANVGNGKTVTATGLTLSGASALRGPGEQNLWRCSVYHHGDRIFRSAGDIRHQVRPCYHQR